MMVLICLHVLQVTCIDVYEPMKFTGFTTFKGFIYNFAEWPARALQHPCTMHRHRHRLVRVLKAHVGGSMSGFPFASSYVIMTALVYDIVARMTVIRDHKRHVSHVYTPVDECFI